MGEAPELLVPVGPGARLAGCHPGAGRPDRRFRRRLDGHARRQRRLHGRPDRRRPAARRLTFVSCGGVDHFNIPDCPTAERHRRRQRQRRIQRHLRNPQLGARSSRATPPTSNRKRRSTARSGPTPSSSSSTSSTPRNSSSSPPRRGYPIVIRGGVTRKVHIPMPSGQYDPASAERHASSATRSSPIPAPRRSRTPPKPRSTATERAEENWSSFEPPALLRRTGLRSCQQRDRS